MNGIKRGISDRDGGEPVRREQQRRSKASGGEPSAKTPVPMVALAAAFVDAPILHFSSEVDESSAQQ